MNTQLFDYENFIFFGIVFGQKLRFFVPLRKFSKSGFFLYIDQHLNHDKEPF